MTSRGARAVGHHRRQCSGHVAGSPGKRCESRPCGGSDGGALAVGLVGFRFAPLRVDGLEAAVAPLQRVEVAAGEEVITQDTPGSRSRAALARSS